MSSYKCFEFKVFVWRWKKKIRSGCKTWRCADCTLIQKNTRAIWVENIDFISHQSLDLQLGQLTDFIGVINISLFLFYNGWDYLHSQNISVTPSTLTRRMWAEHVHIYSVHLGRAIDKKKYTESAQMHRVNVHILGPHAPSKWHIPSQCHEC